MTAGVRNGGADHDLSRRLLPELRKHQIGRRCLVALKQVFRESALSDAACVSPRSFEAPATRARVALLVPHHHREALPCAFGRHALCLARLRVEQVVDEYAPSGNFPVL